MSLSLGLDFGTSNTLIALSDDQINLTLPEFSRVFTQGDQNIEMIPSLIHYAADGRRWIGNQVLDKGLYGSNRTFRWMKRYIGQRSPIKLKLDGTEITPFTAAHEFLSTLLTFARQEIPSGIDSIGLSLPVDSFEHYENWLNEVVHASGFSSIRLIDEPSAAALGYGEHIQPGHVYLIFDFGGGTLHISVVLIESESLFKSFRRCRVLGKSARDIGGSTLDRWIYEYFLAYHHLDPANLSVLSRSNQLLVACEQAKETLSEQEQSEIRFSISDNENFHLDFTRRQFEELMDQKRLFFEINQAIRSALNGARERGYNEETIHSVLMIGGSSLIPSVRKCLEQIFGPEKIHSDHPMDAVVKGAARLAGGADFFDFIQHDYAIRYTDPSTGQYAYQPIIQRGTSYPSREVEAVINIKGAYVGQQKLGLAIFEISSGSIDQNDNLELVFDPNGFARVMPVTSSDKEERNHFWINEDSPTFVIADPPAQPGEKRFELSFYININKQLEVSVTDLLTKKMVLDHRAVIKLS